MTGTLAAVGAGLAVIGAGIGIGILLAFVACMTFANGAPYVVTLAFAGGGAWQLLEGIFGDN